MFEYLLIEWIEIIMTYDFNYFNAWVSVNRMVKIIMT